MKRFYILLVFITLGMMANAQSFQVKVVKISDGDTFTAINRDNLQIKFRIYGIDAPEKKQAFGTKSREFLSSLIFGWQDCYCRCSKSGCLGAIYNVCLHK